MHKSQLMLVFIIFYFITLKINALKNVWKRAQDSSGKFISKRLSCQIFENVHYCDCNRGIFINVVILLVYFLQVENANLCFCQ